MPGADDDQHDPRRVDPIYYADRTGLIHLYSGDVEVLNDGAYERHRGQLTLCLEKHGMVEGRVSRGNEVPGRLGNGATIVGLPADSALRPVRRPRMRGFVEQVPPASPLQAGELANVTRIVVHVAGELTNSLPEVDVQGGSYQPRVDFELLGWPAALVAIYHVGQQIDPAEFSHLVEIVVPDHERGHDAVEMRLSCLFPLLSFVAGQEVGTTLAVGLDEMDEPVWASWASPRRVIGHPGVRWCPPQILPEALPVIARGFTGIWGDSARREAVRRAIGYLGVAARGLLEVRVPMACVGLEVLAWVVLQREAGTAASDLENMRAGPLVRRLLETCEIPVEIPDHFPALLARLDSITEPGWAGPEIVANIRNRLVHPPKRINKLEWPSKDEVLEAWQLATWYLELAVLRQLGYLGPYSSRLKLGKWEGEVEQVPWSTSPTSDT